MSTYFAEKLHTHDYSDITGINPHFYNVVPLTQAGASYSLVAVDCRGVAVETTSGSAVTITIDPTRFNVGDCGEIRQIGAGQVTIVAGGGGSLQSFGGLSAIAGQYGVVGWTIRAGNVVFLTGNLA